MATFQEEHIMDPFPTPIKTYSRRTRVFLKGTPHQIFSPESCKPFEDSLVSETLGKSNRRNCSSVSSKAVLSTSGSGVGVRTVLGSKASDWETCEDLDDSIELPRDATEAIDHHRHRVAFSGEEGEDITLALKQTALKTSNCAKFICDIPPPECMSTIHEFPDSATEEQTTTGLAIFKRDISSSLAVPQKKQLPLVSIPLPNIETCNLLCKKVEKKKKRRAVKQSFELSNDRGDNVHSENKNGKQLKPGQCFNSTLIGEKATNIKEVKITPDVSSITGFLSNKQSVLKSTKSAEIREKAAFVKGDECMADSTFSELDCHLGPQKKTEQCFNSTLINNQAINIKEANVMLDFSSIAEASSDMFPSAVMRQLISEVTPIKPSVLNVNGCLSPVKGKQPLMRQGQLCPKNSTVLFTSQNLDIAEVIPPDLSRVTAASEMTDICEGEDQEEVTLEALECDAPVEEYNDNLRCKVPEEENYDQNKTQESLVQKKPGSKSERQRKGKPRTKLKPNSRNVNPLENEVKTTRTTVTAPSAKVQRKKTMKNKNNQDKSVEDSDQTFHNEPQRAKELKAKSKNIKSVRDARKQKYKTLTDTMGATQKNGGTSNERDNQVQESEEPLITLGQTPEDHKQNSQNKAQKRKKSDFKKVPARKTEANLVCEETVCSIKDKTTPCKKKVRTLNNKNAALEIPQCFIELMDFPSIPMPMRTSYIKLDKRPDQYEEDVLLQDATLTTVKEVL